MHTQNGSEEDQLDYFVSIIMIFVKRLKQALSVELASLRIMHEVIIQLHMHTVKTSLYIL